MSRKRKNNENDDYYNRDTTQKRFKYERRRSERSDSRQRRNKNKKLSRSRSKNRRYGCVKQHYDSYGKRSPSYSSNSSSIDDEVGHYFGEIGDIIDGRYEIKEILGKGTFGKVLKCKDTKYNDSVALKVIRKIDRYIDSAKIEADILKDVFDRQTDMHANYCVKMFSSFYHKGFYVMVFERLGLSLYDLVKRNDFKRFPLSVVRHVSKQLLEGIRFLASINLIHTDLKLENILFVHNTLIKTKVAHNGEEFEIEVPENTRIKIIDFGGATYDNDPDKSTIVNTRQYRGPEVTLQLGWSFPSDIWSVGCIIAEAYSGDLLFQTHDELEHLALIEKLCGRVPLPMIRESRYGRSYFNAEKVAIDRLNGESREYLEKFFPSFEDFFSLSPEDKSSGIAELVRDLLIIDPKERLAPDKALSYSFFSNGNDL